MKVPADTTFNLLRRYQFPLIFVGSGVAIVLQFSGSDAWQRPLLLAGVCWALGLVLALAAGWKHLRIRSSRK